MLPIKPPSAGNIYASDVDVSLGQALSAQWDQAITENPSVAIYRMWTGRNKDDHISFDEARQRVRDAGLDGKLEVSSLRQPSSSEIDLLIERKQDELRRQDILSRSDDGGLAGLAKFGTSFVANAIDPINIGASFVPVGGQLRWAQAAKASAFAGRRFAGRAAIGAVEGATGAALVEPLIYASKMQEQADYDLYDSFLNVTMGTVFGAGLHSSFGAAGDAYRAARKIDQPWTKAQSVPTPEQAVSRDVDVDDIAAIVDSVEAPHGDIGPAAKTAASLTIDEAEQVYRAGLGQLMDGRPLDVEPLLSAFDQKTSDGFSIKDLDPQYFEPAQKIDDLIAAEQMRERATALSQPEVAAKNAAKLAERRALLEDAKKLQTENKPLTESHIEAIRQAAVGKALDEGLPVPDRYTPADMKRIASANRGKFNQIQVNKRRDLATQEAAAKAKAAEEIAARPLEVKQTSTMTEEIARLENEIGEIEKAINNQLEAIGHTGDDAEVKAADELMQKAERWGKIAETAQLCVLRGG